MKIEVPLKPMSINVAWQGKRYKTKRYKNFEKAFFLSTSQPHTTIKEEVVVIYVFYLKYYGRTDVGNLEKPLSDLITKRNYIKDDRYIKSINLIKKRVKDKKEQRIDIYIEPYTEKGIKKIISKIETIYALDI